MLLLSNPQQFFEWLKKATDQEISTKVEQIQAALRCPGLRAEIRGEAKWLLRKVRLEAANRAFK